MSVTTPRKTFIRLKTSTPASQSGQPSNGELNEYHGVFDFNITGETCTGATEDRSEETQTQIDQLENQASSGEYAAQRAIQEDMSSQRLGGDLAGAREMSPRQPSPVPSYPSTPERDARLNSTGTSPTVINSRESNSLTTSDENSEMSGTTDEDENYPSMQNWLHTANEDDKHTMLIKMTKDVKKLRARNRRLRTQKRLQLSAKRQSRSPAVPTAATGATAATVADAALAEMASLVGQQSVRIKNLECRIMEVLNDNEEKNVLIEDLTCDLTRAQESARAANAALGHSQGQHHEAIKQLRRKDEELREMAQQLQQVHDSLEQEVRENPTRRDGDAHTVESLHRECQELEAWEADAQNHPTEAYATPDILGQSSRCEKVAASVWKPLHAQVAVLARDTLRGPIPTIGMCPEFYQQLSEIWPQWKSHVDNPSIRAGIVEAYLWLQIGKYCNLGPNGVWGGSMGDALRSISQCLVDDFLGQDNNPAKVATYCWWRSSGAYMLSQVQNGDESTGIEQAWIDTVDRQVRVLKPLLVRSSQPAENLQALQELRGRLEKMFYKARLLDDAFVSSRHLWRLDFYSHVDAFNADVMVRGFKVKDTDGAPDATAAAGSTPSLSSDGLRVRFVISPALYVLGADKQYETWTLFRKARVDCY